MPLTADSGRALARRVVRSRTRGCCSRERAAQALRRAKSWRSVVGCSVRNVTSGVAVGWAGNADANAKGISQVYKTNAWATGNMLIGGYEAVAEL